MAEQGSRLVRIAWGSVLVGLAVLALKTLAWALTGSVALLSDAAESTVNVATAAAALIAVRIARQPPDEKHPWGHQKAEYLSAIAEGVMIVVAALAILWTALPALLDPQPIDAPWPGLLVSLVASLLNGAWCWVLIRTGRAAKSQALEADGRHLLADVITSAGVILGVVLVALTGILVLDPLLAVLVAGNVLWSGWMVMRASVAGLMDEAVPAEVLETIRGAISDAGAGALEAHDIRTRQAGPLTFIDFHLVMPGETTVAASHAVCDRIEATLRQRVPKSVITIHVEPEEKSKSDAAVIL